MRRRVLKILVILAGLLVVVALGAVLYLSFGDLSRHRGLLEDAVTDALGRKLSIDGKFEPRVSLTTKLVAEDVSLANAEWSVDPAMVRVERISLEVDLWSLISGPIKFRDVDIRGARVLVEEDAEGLSNWAFEIESDDRAEAAAGPPIVFGNAVLRDVTLLYRQPLRERPLEVFVSRLDLQHDATDMFGLRGRGRVHQTPFELEGRIGSYANLVQGEDVDHDLTGSFGDVEIAVEGTIAELATLGGTRASLSIQGPQIGTVAETLDLPSLGEGPFRVQGRISPQPQGLGLEFAGTLGELSAEVSGQIDSLLEPRAVDITAAISGRDLASLGSWILVPGLPAGSFDIGGRVRWNRAGISFEDLQARVGQNALGIDGGLGAPPDFSGTELKVEARGPDLAVFSRLAGVELPGDPFEVEGSVAYKDDSLVFRPLDARVGDDLVHAEGKLALRPGLIASNLRLRVEGPDLSRLAAQFGVDGLPHEAYAAHGRVKVRKDGYELAAVRVRSGEIEVELDGLGGPLPDLEGTDLQIAARGPDLSTLGAYGELPPLPAEPFVLSGRIGVEAGSYQLHQVEAQLGSHRVRVDGTVVPAPGLQGTEVDVELSGPDLAAAARIATEFGLEELPPLPVDDYSISARLGVTESAYEVNALSAEIGETELQLEGFVPVAAGWTGSDLTVQASGPDATVIGNAVGMTLPAEPFRVSGRMERIETGFRFERVRATLGDFRAELDGTLGEPPKLVGTNLDLHARGPDTSLLRPLVDLPPVPFEISGHFYGKPMLFSVTTLEARLGGSDVSGEIHVDLEGKPDFRGTLSSERFDLPELMSKAEAEEVADPAEGPESDKKGLVISDEPFDLSRLQRVDGEIRWSARELVMTAGQSLSQVELGIDLDDGFLQLGPIAGVGPRGGRYTANAELAPAGMEYRMELQLTLEEARLDLSRGRRDPSEWAPIDIQLDLAATGRSPHGLLSSTDGWLVLAVGAAPLDTRIIDNLGTGLFAQILDQMNPFRKEDPTADLECAVIVTTFTDGVARIDPLALRTNKATVIGNGRINFKNERLDLAWAIKPRKGVGLSASTLTNPYVKLGGTLSDPALELKPLDAVATTGAAVATGGLWILGRGLWDRVSAEKQVCDQAFRAAERRVAAQK